MLGTHTARDMGHRTPHKGDISGELYQMFSLPLIVSQSTQRYLCGLASQRLLLGDAMNIAAP